MGECELTGVCPFYNGSDTGSEQLKSDYCANNNLHCAIYMIAQVKGSDSLPGDILPNEKDKAYAEIAKG